MKSLKSFFTFAAMSFIVSLPLSCKAMEAPTSERAQYVMGMLGGMIGPNLSLASLKQLNLHVDQCAKRRKDCMLKWCYDNRDVIKPFLNSHTARFVTDLGYKVRRRIIFL